MLTKSSASSRAIPVQKLIDRVMEDPWIPEHIGKNQKGMQATEMVDEDTRKKAIRVWMHARDEAVRHAMELVTLGIHKQVVNRILEPWMWITVVITGTEWNNFFALRDHPAAEPHFQELARRMRMLKEAHTPKQLEAGEWHFPFITPQELHQEDIATLIKVAVGRCARVSYLTHDGRRDIAEDVKLHDRLRDQNPPHAAPFEHVAVALDVPSRHGNLVGWKSYRMTLPNESVLG
jgi:thymidylate synthase ThyX